MRFAASISLIVCLALALSPPGVSRSSAADSPPDLEKAYHPVGDEFSSLSNAVVELLLSGDAGRFATNWSSSADDWKSILSTHRPAQEMDPLAPFKRSSELQRQKVMSSARVLRNKAAAMRLDFSKGDWHPRVVPPKQVESTRIAALQGENESIHWAEKLEIIFDSNAGAGATNGDLVLAVLGLLRFPAGWRVTEGIQWESFPSNVIDDQTRREFALMRKVEARYGIDDQDDPALLKLGQVFIRFIRERDANVFEKEVFATGESLDAHFQKTGHAGPDRKQLIADLIQRGHEQAEVARASLQQMSDAGVDLEHADIRITSVRVEHVQFQGVPGELAGLMGPELKLTFVVKTEAKAKNGTGLSGDYVLGIRQPIRLGDDWKVLAAPYWVRMPEGVLDREAMEKIKLENYVSEHGVLPVGMAAPDIEFTTLDGGKPMKLSDFKGKVVVLDFWATWCVPCQKPMADLQKLGAAHPGWTGKVVLVPLSIDDELVTARKHVDKRGWTNTFNVWAREGGWRSKPAAAYRVSAVPCTYIIDAGGKIAAVGNPAKLNLEQQVESALNPTPGRD